MPSFNFRRNLPSFWTIQLVGWIVYFAVIYITFLTIAQPNNYLNLFFLKGFRAFTGFVLTSFLLRPIYRYFRKNFSITQLVLLVLVCAVIVGTVWTAIEAAYSFTTAVFNTANYLARSPRIILDYAMTLTAWSALYLGIKTGANGKPSAKTLCNPPLWQTKLSSKCCVTSSTRIFFLTL